MVYSMMHPYFYSNATVYMDNLYTTHELPIRLRDKGVGVIGTVRRNNLPKDLKPLFKEFSKDRKSVV